MFYYILKRSTLSSRRDVDILRKFKFRNSGKELTYVPIMASNMDGVGTFPMARVLQEYKMLTVIRKHYTLDDWKQAPGTGLKFKYVRLCWYWCPFGTRMQKIIKH